MLRGSAEGCPCAGTLPVSPLTNRMTQIHMATGNVERRGPAITGTSHLDVGEAGRRNMLDMERLYQCERTSGTRRCRIASSIRNHDEIEYIAFVSEFFTDEIEYIAFMCDFFTYPVRDFRISA